MSKETEQKSINGSISKVGCEGTLKELLEVLKGYDVFTAHMYCGLIPMLKDTMLGTTDISSKTIRIGLIFYLL